MAEFFIRTDATASGPFTGIELREAAMAGILRPDSVIAGSPEGPWVLASIAGLFSDKRVALPHPSDVVVPQYQVRGMPGAFQGPFKLRELIGFAVRGMLPSDALLQSAPNEPWVPVHRIKILSACLHGELALIDHQGKVIRRAVHPNAQPVTTGTARAPEEVSRSADSGDSTAFASSSAAQDVSPSSLPSPVNAANKNHAETPSPAAIDSQRGWLRVHLQSLRSIVSDSRVVNDGLLVRRILVFSVCLFGFVAFALSVVYWQNRPMQQVQLLGQWIGNSANRDGETLAQFGIAFRQDGRCVVCNPTGESWTGDYQWVDRSDQSAGLQKVESLTVKVDTAEPSHSIDVVRPSDGYLRFVGGRDVPTIDGHRLADAFVRREGQSLLIGYLVSVQHGIGQKQMSAAWITTTFTRKSSVGDGGTATPELLAIKPTDLLSAFGVPDEARIAYPFEISAARQDGANSSVQMLRFGTKKWLLGTDAKIVAIADAKHP